MTVIVRPESIQLEGRPGKGIAWTGIVRQRFFRGARNVYTIEAGGHRFGVDAAPDQVVVPGSAITLRVDAAQTWAVRD